MASEQKKQQDARVARAKETTRAILGGVNFGQVPKSHAHLKQFDSAYIHRDALVVFGSVAGARTASFV